MIALPLIILVGLLSGLVFNSVKNTNEIAVQAYQQQHQQQATPAEAHKTETGR